MGAVENCCSSVGVLASAHTWSLFKVKLHSLWAAVHPATRRGVPGTRNGSNRAIFPFLLCYVRIPNFLHPEQRPVAVLSTSPALSLAGGNAPPPNPDSS